jgi:integration host factor subunit alpha
MSLGKKDIAKNISSRAQVSQQFSGKFLDHFIEQIKTKSKFNIVQISNFGTFYYKNSPSRTGRNPRTKKKYLISARSKLNLKVSNKVKSILN